MKRAKIVVVDLPREIVENILSRLPVRSLARLRCVSKFWRTLIASKRFIKTHLQNSTKNLSLSNYRIIVDFFGLSYLKQLKQCSWSSLLNEPVVNSFVFDNHFNIRWDSTSDDLINIRWSSINLVGCCNGLVCILLDRKIVILWNPATRISKKLPDPFHGIQRNVGCGNPNINNNYKMNIFTKYGLGYDEFSDDYKVVVIGIDAIYRGFMVRRDISRIYSLKTNSWKTLKDKDVPSYNFHGAGKYASGNLHWRSVDMDIVSFDIKSEVCRIVEQPNYSESPFCQTLGVMGGCLSVLCEYLDFDQLDVWVMKEYGVKESWAKVVAILNFPYPPIGEREVISLFCRVIKWGNCVTL